jgi:hypothetical protein
MDGVKGDVGLRGNKGSMGDADVGDKGQGGPIGPAGEPGADIKGDKGYKGYKGAEGPKGYKGNPGEEPPCDCPPVPVCSFTVIAFEVMDADEGNQVTFEVIEWVTIYLSEPVVHVQTLFAVTLQSSTGGGISNFDQSTGPMVFSAPENGVYFFQVTSTSTALTAVTVYVVGPNGNELANTGRPDPNGNPYPMGNVGLLYCLQVGDKVTLQTGLPVEDDGYGYAYGLSFAGYSADPSRVLFTGFLVAAGPCQAYVAW